MEEYKMTVGHLREALEGQDDDTVLVFQGNIPGEEDEIGEYTYTTNTGHVFGAFFNGKEFVIDCAITDSEY